MRSCGQPMKERADLGFGTMDASNAANIRTYAREATCSNINGCNQSVAAESLSKPTKKQAQFEGKAPLFFDALLQIEDVPQFFSRTTRSSLCYGELSVAKPFMKKIVATCGDLQGSRLSTQIR